MSYEIVYNRQFLKIDDKIIPLCLSGSNNCYELSFRNRYKRERNWHPLYFGKNTMIALTPNEIMDRINSVCDGVYQEHFVRNGKWVDDKALIRFYENGIKKAKTIEELYEEYFFYGLTGYFSIWKNHENTIENRTHISSSDDLRKYLDEAQKRLDTKSENEEIYICLKYDTDTFSPRQKKERKPKERLTDYYAIKINDCGYLLKLTKRRVQYTFYISNNTKQFKSEKDANLYIDKIKERFNCSFSVEHIVA